MSDLKLLNSSRKYIRSQVTRSFNKGEELRQLSSEDKAALKAALLSYQVDLKDLNQKILALKFSDIDDESALESEFASCNEYSDRIFKCIALLDSNTGHRGDSLDEARTLLKSPTAPLPKFSSGEEEDILKFFKQFEETLSRFKYPDSDKLLLLRQQVSGRGLTLLNSLETSKQLYVEAKKLLTTAFALPLAQKFKVIRQISEIKLDYGEEPFEYISKMRTLTESVKDLGITQEHFMQYFFWHGLNESFRNHLTQITNKNRPSLAEISEHFFEACERYNNSQKHLKGKKKEVACAAVTKVETQDSVANLAVNVDGSEKAKSRGCSICTKIQGKEADHTLSTCPKFITAKDKVEKLKSFNGCIKCASFTHCSEKCRFRFKRRCFYCNEWHFGFLCTNSVNTDSEKKTSKCASSTNTSKSSSSSNPSKPSSSSNNNKSPSVKDNSTTSGLIVMNAMPSVNTEVILPTFTCKLSDDTPIRVLRDGGCQCNFVKESIANSQGLKVLQDNISMQINGFNGSKVYQTKLVAVELVLGTRTCMVEAVCVPDINVTLTLPNLSKVVKGFIDRGYSLADGVLLNGSEIINNLDFILGAISANCLLETFVPFGENHTSVYSSSAVGIMLVGQIDRLLVDLPHLPRVSTKPNYNPQCRSNIDSKCINFVSTDTCFVDDIDVNSMEQVQATFSVLNESGELDDKELQRAADQILESQCLWYTNYDNPETSFADGVPAGADFGSDFSFNNSSDSSGINANKKPRRKAALDSESRTRQILNMH